MDFNINDYIFQCNDEKIHTKAIQSAIDTCAASGGGRADNKLSNITFNNCSFTKIKESDLKYYKNHGSYWGRPQDNKIFSYVENIVLNGTSFTAE